MLRSAVRENSSEFVQMYEKFFSKKILAECMLLDQLRKTMTKADTENNPRTTSVTSLMPWLHVK